MGWSATELGQCLGTDTVPEEWHCIAGSKCHKRV